MAFGSIYHYPETVKGSKYLQREILAKINNLKELYNKKNINYIFPSKWIYNGQKIYKIKSSQGIVIRNQ